MQKLKFAKLDENMLIACESIAQTAPDPWNLNNFKAAINDEKCSCFAAIKQEIPVAFACFMATYESADLQILAVSTTCRRKGVAQGLMLYCLSTLQKKGVSRVLLELRQGNYPAFLLYKKLGFAQLALRKEMYANPKENGILMELLLTGWEAPEYDYTWN